MPANNPLVTKCTAHSKRTREPCQRPPMRGATVCYHHGGKTPRGMLLPQFQHGKYSKYLPTGLRASYEQALRDPELCALKEELSLCDARLGTLLQQLDVDGTVTAWRSLQQAYLAFETAQRQGDLPGMRDHLSTVRQLILAGTRDLELWAEVYTVIETRRKLAETEHRRLVTGQHMLTAERAQILIAAILSTVKEQVSATVAPEQATKLLANLSVAFSRLALLETR